MKKVIMVREQIIRSKEYIIDPNTMGITKEIWEHKDCDPFWNEYYRVGIFDDEEYEEEYQALCEVGEDFMDFKEAKAHYDKLQKELEEGRL